jgi:capsular polysaccharide export protein
MIQSLHTRAQGLIARILVTASASTITTPIFRRASLPMPRNRVLVVDLTRDDTLVLLGQAGGLSFRAMLQAAMAENPDAEIWLKPHPDVLAGKKRGYLYPSATEGVRVLSSDSAPHSVLRHMDKVYTVSSQLGFEALLRGLPVRCFGMPFYADGGANAGRTLLPQAHPAHGTRP